MAMKLDHRSEGAVDAHKYRGSLKSSMKSITQIYSSTQGEHKNTSKTSAIEASHSQPHLCINSLKKEVVIVAVESKE
jgi:hypothetical protein